MRHNVGHKILHKQVSNINIGKNGPAFSMSSRITFFQIEKKKNKSQTAVEMWLSVQLLEHQNLTLSKNLCFWYFKILS